MTEQPKDQSRRTWLMVSCAVGAAGGVGAAIPILNSMSPSERAKAAGAPVEFDVSKLRPGEKATVEWRGKPVWILRRTKEMLEDLKKIEAELADPQSTRNPGEINPKFAQNEWRSTNPEFLVVVGICTHLGCSPLDRLSTGPQPSLPDDWMGGFYCPCHGSIFDLAGRVYKNKPAPDNLPVPPYTFISETKLLIGSDKA